MIVGYYWLLEREKEGRICRDSMVDLIWKVLYLILNVKECEKIDMIQEYESKYKEYVNYEDLEEELLEICILC